MKIVDVHCHLESSEFSGNLDTVVSDAVDAGVVKFLTSSVSPDQWETSKSIAEKYSEVEFSLGIHPWYISPLYLNRIDDLDNAKKLGAVAIGEIGLDKKIASPDIDLQLTFFEKQLEIARSSELPVIIHCRGAFNELIQSLKRVGLAASGGIVHSFSGSAELAEQLIKYGLSFSIGGILTYRKSKKREKLLKKIYPGHLLLETDSPDIPPVSIRDGVNLPKYIIYNLKAASEILEESEEKVALSTTQNAVRIFNLKV